MAATTTTNPDGSINLAGVTLTFKAGLEANRQAYTPLDSEVIIAKRPDNSVAAYVGDGLTPGGKRLNGDLETRLATIESAFALTTNVDDPDKDTLQEIVDYIEQVETAVQSGGAVVNWANVAGKPASFTPAAHSHPISEVTGLQAALDVKAETKADVGLGNVENLSSGAIIAKISSIGGGSF